MHGQNIPVGPAAAVLLGLLGVGIGKPVLAKELGHLLVGAHGAVRQTGVVLVAELVGASHCGSADG